MTLLMMVVAVHIGVKAERPVQKGLNRLIRVSAYASVEPDPRLGQGVLGSGADAAAEEGVHMELRQQSSKGAMAAALRAHHLLADHRAVFHLVYFELLTVAEVLKHLAAFISDCDFHLLRSSRVR